MCHNNFLANFSPTKHTPSLSLTTMRRPSQSFCAGRGKLQTQMAQSGRRPAGPAVTSNLGPDWFSSERSLSRTQEPGSTEPGSVHATSPWLVARLHAGRICREIDWLASWLHRSSLFWCSNERVLACGEPGPLETPIFAVSTEPGSEAHFASRGPGSGAAPANQTRWCCISGAWLR